MPSIRVGVCALHGLRTDRLAHGHPLLAPTVPAAHLLKTQSQHAELPTGVHSSGYSAGLPLPRPSHAKNLLASASHPYAPSSL